LPNRINENYYNRCIKEDVKALYIYLDTLQAKVYEAHRRLIDTEEIATAEAIKNKFTGKAEKPRMLVPIFQDHNNKIKALLGGEFSKGTLCRYTTALKHTITKNALEIENCFCIVHQRVRFCFT
jgi:hypothetical protein